MTKYPKPQFEIPGYIQVFEPGTILLHPDLDRRSFDYDVALISIGKRLRRDKKGVFVVDKNDPGGKITFSRFVRPVCLPCMTLDSVDALKSFNKIKCGTTGQHGSVGSSIIATGFGVKGYNTKDRPDTLQQGLLALHDNGICADNIRDIVRHNPDARFTNRMFCAAGGNDTDKIDSCTGDSGGPVVRRITENGRSYWIQIGVVSWGIKCAGKHPGYYASVPAVMSWIFETAVGKARGGVTCPEKIFTDNNHYNVTSCPPGKPAGATCPIQCSGGHKFITGAAVWTAICKYNDSNRLSAEWDFTSAPYCEETKCKNDVFKNDSKYRFTSCRSETEVGSNCSIQCKSGYTFISEKTAWTATCNLESNSLVAEWDVKRAPACVDCEEPYWCRTLKPTCKTNLLLRIRCKVSCGLCNRGLWDRWAKWSDCTRTCGGGIRTTTRYCLGPGYCVGKTERIKRCNTHPCQGNWGLWTSWTKCHAPCGGGVSIRIRSCYGGRNCEGDAREARSCNTQACIGTWSPWNSWTHCSVSCGGGAKSRRRLCRDKDSCVGKRDESRDCNIQACPGAWGKWTSWSKCHATCGDGLKIRIRSCVGPGHCVGKKRETGRCIRKQCSDDKSNKIRKTNRR